MSLNDFLTTLLQAVIIAAAPVITTYVVKALKELADNLATKTDNETAQKYLQEAATAITTAVTYTSQTYVDALKTSGQFSLENQKDALQKAMDKAKSLLSESAVEFIGEAYGDLNNYLESKIEEEVKKQKVFAPVELQAISTETVTQDVTAIATTAAAAAATAATAAIKQANSGKEKATE